MYEPVPLPQLLDEWLEWAEWVAKPDRDPAQASNLTGFDEFDWVVRNKPEFAWQAIVAALHDPRLDVHLGLMAAGPLEDLLSAHGPSFIDRVETEARSNPKFASMLGGVWRHQMTEEVWGRVQAVWDSRGWDGSRAKGLTASLSP
jgi:hypothetical protein